MTGKVDNKSISRKVKVRRELLDGITSPVVLDLYCGLGEMYKNCYQDLPYKGVDLKKVHDPRICDVADNISYVQTKDLEQYNFYDLDAYGCPWSLAYLILRKRTGTDKIAMAVTDGSPTRMKRNGQPLKIFAGTNALPANMDIPGIYRWYLDMIGTLLKDAESRYGYKVECAKYIWNKDKTACYWGIKMARNSL